MKAVMHEVLKRARDAEPHEILRPANDDPEPFPDNARVFVCGDWGTGAYGAPVIAGTINEDQGRFNLLLHLGDIHYSGQPAEVLTLFLDIWPKRPDAISRTLNGNHDMYSGGFRYFDPALPKLEQKSSYFAFQDKEWTLVCLDPAHKDNNLDEEQTRWVTGVVKSAGRRKVLLFSHHPLLSNF
jgi:hypothetical protein